MALALKYVKTLRTHWKKSTFAAAVIAYGYNYADEYFQTQELIRQYCKQAVIYGEETLPNNLRLKTVTVILNPSANKRKAAKEFDKYCAPILHLAGFYVDVVKTESEGHAKTLIESLNSTDAVVVAGGDGTLSEVITGLLRRTDENNQGLVPVGVLPLGRNNNFAKSLFPNSGRLEHVRSLLDASLAVVEEITKPVDVIRIEVQADDESKDSKPIYALSGIKWGAYRDAEVKQDSYWYFGSLRKYATYLFNGYKSALTWNCEAEINYYPPCEGCLNCVLPSKQANKKWYQRFSRDNQKSQYSAANPECMDLREKKISTSDLILLTSNALLDNTRLSHDVPKLRLFVGPKNVDYLEFVKQGWRYENGEKREVDEIIEARKIELKPVTSSGKAKKESWFSIDNENFEIRPVSVTLLPKFINVFCKKQTM